ncbi:hypothetical protein MM236_18865 [Belliella sp. DSM 107340]|uniref:Uncharacterized protein n=1 Tax=Belliella calami TaxID=2923436 RepID=A0ABS9UTY0_9BACT|nr:hypothetical protein [Belliella calami]MCH7400064.1 hypothetical protein [Belliella calami]
MKVLFINLLLVFALFVIGTIIGRYIEPTILKLLFYSVLNGIVRKKVSEIWNLYMSNPLPITPL